MALDQGRDRRGIERPVVGEHHVKRDALGVENFHFDVGISDLDLIGALKRRARQRHEVPKAKINLAVSRTRIDLTGPRSLELKSSRPVNLGLLYLCNRVRH